jgi:hypothetical protein
MELTGEKPQCNLKRQLLTNDIKVAALEAEVEGITTLHVDYNSDQHEYDFVDIDAKNDLSVALAQV